MIDAPEADPNHGPSNASWIRNLLRVEGGRNVVSPSKPDQKRTIRTGPRVQLCYVRYRTQ